MFTHKLPQFLYAVPDISGSGGWTWPGTSSKGFLNAPSTITHYQGPNIIQDIPDFQRDYNLRDALITRVREGRLNLMRVLLDYARTSGAFVTSDVQSRWYLDYVPTARIYLKARTNQGGATGSQVSTGTFYLDSVEDAKRIQSDDLLVVNPIKLPADRNANGVIVDYVVSPAGGAVYVKKELIATPMPELARVVEVNYTTGAVKVERNITGDNVATAKTAPGFTVIATVTTDPGSNIVNQEDAFLIKSTRPGWEGRDDALVWSRSNTWDYNYSQYVYRKWGVTDIQENVYRRGQPGSPYAKNRLEALEQFFEEMEYYALFGIRTEEYDAGGRWRGHAGGFLENIPSGHFEVLQEPLYTSSTKSGDFTMKNFNKVLENKFYYGSQEKILICGVKFHTAFSWMINNMTQNIPVIVDRWSVRGRQFDSSNGGSIFVVVSDSMTLNGMSHMAILLDPETFMYGHLQNMDVNVMDPLPSTNIHEKHGEVFGVFTFKRTNPDANWVFILQPNVET